MSMTVGKWLFLASNRRHVETRHRRALRDAPYAGRSAVSESTSNLLEFRQREVEYEYGLFLFFFNRGCSITRFNSPIHSFPGLDPLHGGVAPSSVASA